MNSFILLILINAIAMSDASGRLVASAIDSGQQQGIALEESCSLLPRVNDSKNSRAAKENTFPTNGVHNNLGCDAPGSCIYNRSSDEPQDDPMFPTYWRSDWKMYRIFGGYEEYPPPYAIPPAGLSPSNYSMSYGETLYDSTYIPPDGDGVGAMKEHSKEFCLPIFPQANNYTCSFISLGNKAYFLKYDPPSCCQFSLDNHPPRRDFVKHLKYSRSRSQQLSVQAYDFDADGPGGEKILFGVAFDNFATVDSHDPSLPYYKHPQSFFFSGSTTKPPDAPMVSQNYLNFRQEKPTDDIWNEVIEKCPKVLEWCHLFDASQ